MKIWAKEKKLQNNFRDEMFLIGSKYLRFEKSEEKKAKAKKKRSEKSKNSRKRL